ncbi:tif11 [Symbiodinium sp. KB8]|nr:tif11 [Symbiodinium sp. KB8]
MPKNKGKGGKNRRRGKKDSPMTEKRELDLAEEGTCYAQVVRMLGNGRLTAHCFHDDKQRMGTICGKMRKRVWVAVGDIVLLALREYQDSKADVIGKYSPDEARELKKRGELPATVRVNDIGGLDDAAADDKEDAGFEFITTGQFVVGGEGEEEGKGSTADAAAAAGGADSALLANGEINFDAI